MLRVLNGLGLLWVPLGEEEQDLEPERCPSRVPGQAGHHSES